MSHTENPHAYEASVVFTPRLYIQRYEKVQKFLEKHSDIIQNILDIGCAECKFLQRLCRSVGDGKFPKVRSLVGVDVKQDLLLESAKHLQPLHSDFLTRRECPLSVDLLAKDVVESRLGHFDAVTCIEMIEHMELPCLKALVETVFGRMQPQIVVVTTPNKDFNPLFGISGSATRHPEHNFEWSQKEFAAHCDRVRTMYPEYSVMLDGVGEHPTGCTDFGYCSLIAVFEKKVPVPRLTDSQFLLETPIVHIEYPFGRSNMPLDVRLRNECEYYMGFVMQSGRGDWISLDTLCRFRGISQLCHLPTKLAHFLSSSGWTVDFQKLRVLFHVEENDGDTETSHVRLRRDSIENIEIGNFVNCDTESNAENWD